MTNRLLPALVIALCAAAPAPAATTDSQLALTGVQPTRWNALRKASFTFSVTWKRTEPPSSTVRVCIGNTSNFEWDTGSPNPADLAPMTTNQAKTATGIVKAKGTFGSSAANVDFYVGLGDCSASGTAAAASNVVAAPLSGIVFSAPSTGASVTAGSSYTIRWNPMNITGPMKLYYYLGNTNTRAVLGAASTVSAESGQYTWTVPSDLAAASNAKFVINSTTNTSHNWESPVFSMVASTAAGATLEWKWTARLTEAHFTALGVTLSTAQKENLGKTSYSIGSILTSKTDRLFASGKCIDCHTGTDTQSPAKYQPALPVSPSAHNRKDRGGSLIAAYRWDNPGTDGVVAAFEATTGSSKPVELEKLFRKWVTEGARY